MGNPLPNSSLTGKERNGLCWISSHPQLWFKDTIIDDRDKALLSASPVSFVDYKKGSYLRKIYHMKSSKDGFKQTDWVVETDRECRQMVYSAGAQAVGFESGNVEEVPWVSMTVNVNIDTPASTGLGWGFLSTGPKNIRLFKGPPETCSFHAWDAMILRDCTTNTDSFGTIKEIASKKWDILLMKMCEDYDHPWVVLAVRDAGARPEIGPSDIE